MTYDVSAVVVIFAEYGVLDWRISCDGVGEGKTDRKVLGG